MKINLQFLVLALLALTHNSCKEVDNSKEKSKITIEKVNQQDSKKLVDQVITQIDTTTVISNNVDECTFDQSTQTDDFLKGIKELEEYRWDNETKTAEIVLNDHWSLTITRGGCDHFTMSAKFIYDRILDVDKDEKQIFDSIIWITSLLEDFDGKEIKETILNNQFKLIKEGDHNYYANFMNEKLYELYYFNFNNKDVTTFEIGYYYN